MFGGKLTTLTRVCVCVVHPPNVVCVRHFVVKEEEEDEERARGRDEGKGGGIFS